MLYFEIEKRKTQGKSWENTGKSQWKHGEFWVQWSVATLIYFWILCNLTDFFGYHTFQEEIEAMQ